MLSMRLQLVMKVAMKEAGGYICRSSFAILHAYWIYTRAPVTPSSSTPTIIFHLIRHHCISIHSSATSCTCSLVFLHFMYQRCRHLSLYFCCGDALVLPHCNCSKWAKLQWFIAWNLHPTYSIFRWKRCLHSYTEVCACQLHCRPARH